MAAVMSSGRSTGRGPWLPQEHHPGIQRGLPQQQGGSVTLAAEEQGSSRLDHHPGFQELL